MSNVEEPLSAGFTAVNGKDAATSHSANLANGTRRGSDERANGQPRISPPGQEKLTITTTTTQREDWVPANTDRHPYQSAPYPDPEASHKRKRSGSIEHNSSSANSYHSHALPSSTKQTPTTATTESDTPREDNLRSESQSGHLDPHMSDAPYRHYMPSPADDRHGPSGPDQWHPRQYQPPFITSDEHLGEVLQRASQNLDPRHHEYASPGDDDRSPYHNQYDRRETSSDLKKRKRNFSNRTKTGCMTCRRRKKKCDENRPECKSREEMEVGVCEPSNNSQVTTANGAVLFVRVTRRATLGQIPNKSKHQFHCNPKMNMRIRLTPTLHILRVLHLVLIASLVASRCLDIEDRTSELTPNMEETSAVWTMISQARLRFPVPLGRVPTIIACRPFHTLSKHQLQSRHQAVLIPDVS